jgi:hypothetical protein
MLGAWFSIMMIMAMADWFLPFVYNIGFHGFQASLMQLTSLSNQAWKKKAR